MGSEMCIRDRDKNASFDTLSVELGRVSRYDIVFVLGDATIGDDT